ncbi:MAG: hypothetical protein WC365_06455 [Candidatus Babeliales bacterium]
MINEFTKRISLAINREIAGKDCVTQYLILKQTEHTIQKRIREIEGEL